MRFDRADGEGDGHSIKEWGWTTPALVGEDGGLIAGHARVLAARQLGIAEIPVMVAAGWSEAQKRAYVLADDQQALGRCSNRSSPGASTKS
jgi:ParB-like chromosome segregation protein Spo0J